MAANNTYFDIASLRASDITKATAFLAQDASVPNGLFYWTWGDFTGRADDENIVKAESMPLGTGAWVRQAAFHLQFSAVTFRTRAEASDSHIPDFIKVVTVNQYDASSRVNPAPYKEIADTGTLEPWQFRSNENTRRWEFAATEIFPSQMGARVDGATDDTAAFQAALDYMGGRISAGANGGLVQLDPGTMNVDGAQYPSFVTIRGAGTFSAPSGGSRLAGTGATPFIIGPKGASVNSAVLQNFVIIGPGTTTNNQIGLECTCRNSIFSQLSFQQTGGSAIRSSASANNVINLFEKIYVNGANLDASISAPCWAVDIDGTDHHFLGGHEWSAGLPASASSEQYRRVFRLRGGGHTGGSIVSEFGVTCFDLEADGLQLNNLRADWAQREAFRINASGFIRSSACRNPSLAGSGTYSSVVFTSMNKDIAVDIESYQDSGGQHKYGFVDTQNIQDVSNRIRYSEGCRSLGHALATFSQATDSNSVHAWGSNGYAARGGTAPNVDNVTTLFLNNDSPTTVTNFINGVNGQPLTIFFDNNTTIENNGLTIVTKSGLNIVGPSTTAFMKYGVVWREV